MHTQLKLEYDTIKELRGLSGFGWDPKLCTVIADPDVWIAYIKVSPDGMVHSQDTHEYMLTEPEYQQGEDSQNVSHEAISLIQYHWGSR